VTPSAELPRAVIFGLGGPRLTAPERAFMGRARPFGFILFERNCADPDQVRALTAELRATVGRADAPILIDEEGGRVQRLKPPHWTKRPAAAAIGALYRADRERGLRAAWLAGRLIAADLFPLGIDVDCAPVADVPAPGSHRIIGDRAFGTDPDAVAALARAMSEGLIAGGVAPVAKHIPGHGRARADSHAELPRVGASRAELAAIDFAPFRALADLPFAMTAHVLYEAFDAARPATLSPVVIAQVIRAAIGFEGLLMSDDLSMAALAGGLGARAAQALAAGCDLVLHCNGKLSEMEEVAAMIPALPAARLAYYRSWAARLAPAPVYRDAAALELAGLLAAGAAAC
jgi:beta-N-acetylhexosaminidase